MIFRGRPANACGTVPAVFVAVNANGAAGKRGGSAGKPLALGLRAAEHHHHRRSVTT
jgi:hypothetical protein